MREVERQQYGGGRRRWVGRAVAAVVAVALLGLVAPPTPSAASRAPAPEAFVPLASPSRLVDTRDGEPTVDGALAGIGVREAGSTLEVPVVGRAGLAADAGVVVLNVTAVDAREPGHVKVFPCDADRPLASNLNHREGTTVAVLAVSRVGDGGSVCIHTSGRTDLVVDLAGGFPAADVETLPAPRRLLDTRPGQATYDGEQQGAGAPGRDGTVRLPVAGRAGVPSDPGAVILSVTVDRAEEAGFVTVHACDEPRPTASNLNHAVGQTVANAVVTGVGADGDVCVYTMGATDVVVDVTGWFAPDAFTSLPAPRRVLDTREGEPTFDDRFAGDGLRAGGHTLELDVAGRAGVPEEAGAVLLNVTSVGSTAAGFVTVFPGGSDRPAASNLNHHEGVATANAVVTALGADGAACLFTMAPTHLVVDVVGWLPGTPASVGSGCPATAPAPPERDRVFDRRIVAMYGNDIDSRLGALGEQSPEASVARLESLVAPYREGDLPVQGAFELIATIALASAGEDGLYRSRSTAEQVRRYVDVARDHGLYVILDIQPGRARFLPEVQVYEEFLLEPHVGVALDPEWRVGPDQTPGGGFVGQIDATEVNEVSAYLADLVAQHDLPEKLLVVHQFQIRMITDKEAIVDRDGVAINIHMDGFGTRAEKLNTYSLVQVEPPFFNGFKLFFDEDIDMFSPAEVMALDPSPVFISYQ